MSHLRKLVPFPVNPSKLLALAGDLWPTLLMVLY